MFNGDKYAGGKAQSKPTNSMETDVTFDPAMEQVKQYCLGQREVDLPTTASHFTNMAEPDLSRLATLPSMNLPLLSVYFPSYIFFLLHCLGRAAREVCCLYALEELL